MNNQGYYCGHCGGTEFGGAKGGDCLTCGKDDKQVPWGGWSLG